MSWTETDLAAAVALLQERHPAIVSHFGLTEQPEAMETIAGQALDCAGVGDDLPYALDVFAWRHAENAAVFSFDFAADGGTFKLSTIVDQARKMRLKAEDEAYRRGLSGFEWPAAEIQIIDNAALTGVYS